MMHEPIIAAAPVTSTLSLSADALRSAMKLLAPLAPKPHRNNCAALSLARIVADGSIVAITATDLTTWATVTLVLDAPIEAPVEWHVQTHAFAAAVVKLPKGSLASIRADDDRLVIVAGRGRMTVALDPDAVAPRLDIAGGEAAPSDPSDPFAAIPNSLVASDAAVRIWTRGAKIVGNNVVTLTPARENDGTCSKVAIEAGPLRIVAKVGEPALDLGAPKRDPYSYRTDANELARVRDYLDGLARRYSLPVLDAPRNVVIVDGVARGMTIGDKYWDDDVTEELPHDFELPAGFAWNEPFTIGGDTYTFGTVGPRRHARIRHGSGEVMYPIGAYSIVMPRGNDAVVADVTVEVDGDVMPIAVSASSKIKPIAEQVRAWCGPIDRSNVVEIAPLKMWRGEVLGPDWIIPTPPRIADPLKMTAAETRAYLDACRPTYAPVAVAAPEAVEPAAVKEAPPAIVAIVGPIPIVTPVADGPPDVVAMAARIAKLESVVDDLMVIALRETSPPPEEQSDAPARGNDEAPPRLPSDPRARAVVANRDTAVADAAASDRAKRLRIVRLYLAMRDERAAMRREIVGLTREAEYGCQEMRSARDGWKESTRLLLEAEARTKVANKRAERAEFDAIDARQQLATATARLAKLEQETAPAIDVAHGRLVKLERDVAAWEGRARAAGWRPGAADIRAIHAAHVAERSGLAA